MQLNPGTTAPKDGTVFLAVVKHLPYAVSCVYSAGAEAFCLSTPQTNLYQGEWSDRYFENDWLQDEADLLGWMALPSIPTPEKKRPWSCNVGNCGNGQCVHQVTDEACPLCESNMILVKPTGFKFCSNDSCGFEKEGAQ